MAFVFMFFSYSPILVRILMGSKGWGRISPKNFEGILRRYVGKFAFRIFSYYPFSLFKSSLDAGLMSLEIEFLRYNKRIHSSFKSFKSVKMPRKGLMKKDLSKLDVNTICHVAHMQVGKKIVIFVMCPSLKRFKREINKMKSNRLQENGLKKSSWWHKGERNRCKFSSKDLKGAKKLALKAQNLFPGLDVHVAAENKVSDESDYYGILGVNPLADDDTGKKHYRKLALSLHPDKNKSLGTEGAFQLACSFLKQRVPQNVFSRVHIPPTQNGFLSVTKSAAARTAGADAQTKSQKDETNGTAKTVPTSVPSSSSEQIAPETSKVKGSRKKNKVNGTTKVGRTSTPASFNEQIAPKTTPGSCLTEVKTCQEKDKVNGTTKTGPASIPLPVTKQMKPKMFWTIPPPNINAYPEVAWISQGTGNNISAPETCKITGIEAGNGTISQRGPLKRDREEAGLVTNIEEALRNKIAKKEAKSASKKVKSVKTKQDIKGFDAIKETGPIKNHLIKKATTEIKKKLDEWSSEAVKIADMANGFSKSNEADVPDPDFHEKSFKEVKKVSKKMKVCWLSSKPNKKPLPFPGFLEAFGKFQPGKHETVTSPNYFSRKASFTKQKNGNIRVFPKKGSACALYKRDKMLDTIKHTYEIVEVDEYSEETGITVAPLVKVAGFKTVFHRHLDNKETKVISGKNFLKISHQMPSYLLTGQESANAPKGCLDLDPAAIPPEFLHVLADVKEADKMDIDNAPSTDGVCSI
ncbi:dnaJ domain-containing protein [Artemisia annua]|uniref:DnaJ domain-containing protein n=1 Tax=Artemisia annua TaxID=35608 RepID=A0A2U1NF24_ARTAN|nr:dnaJ domain-containing protein [Artemisia annua]